VAATSAFFWRAGLDRTFARAAAWTPSSSQPMSASPAISLLSMSFALTLKLTTILLASCLACGSSFCVQLGLGTSVSLLFSV
jgi:hypothetical protein